MPLGDETKMQPVMELSSADAVRCTTCAGSGHADRRERDGGRDIHERLGRLCRAHYRLYAEKAGLTNEVQRRAKRVRCNAGLGSATRDLSVGLR
jgi:hypothetical protein